MLWSLAARAGIPAARSALRFLSRLRKPPKTGGITVYRGEDFIPRETVKEVGKRMYGKDWRSTFGYESPLRRAAVGRWFSARPKDAMGFAGSRRYSFNPANIINWGGGYTKGRIKKLTLTAKEAKLANKVKQRIAGGMGEGDYMVVPRHLLKKAETDQLRTFIANMYRMMGKKHGGLARILEV